MRIDELRESEWIESVEPGTEYDWSDNEHWYITTTPGAYDTPEGLDVVLNIPVLWEDGRTLVCPKPLQ